MDDELRKAEREWRRDTSDDGAALAYLSAIVRGDVAAQILARLCRLELRLAEPPTWSQVVTWWTGPQPPLAPLAGPAAPPDTRVTRYGPTRRAPLGAAYLGTVPLDERRQPRPTGSPTPPDPNSERNRGYSWILLCALCRCGHYRGDHAAHANGCDTCGARCTAFTLPPAGTCTYRTPCQVPALPGYGLCRQHLASLVPWSPLG